MADSPDPLAVLPSKPPSGESTSTSGGGSISFSAGMPDLEPKLPELVALPTPKGPCGFPIPQIPGLPLPDVPSLTDLFALFGIPVPEIELPTVCPELVELALVAAVASYEAARGG